MAPPAAPTPPSEVRLVPLEPRGRLGRLAPGGIDPVVVETAAGEGLRSVTGGGLVALLDPASGLVGLWDQEAACSGALVVKVDDLLLEPSTSLLLAPGSWERTVVLPGGDSLVERGLLPDAAAGLVLQWTLETGGATREPGPIGPDEPRVLDVGLAGAKAGRVAGASLSLPIHPGAPVWAMIPRPGSEPEASRLLAVPVEARALARRHRHDPPDRPSFGIRETRREQPSRARFVPDALAELDECSLGTDPEGVPRPPFLAGIDGGRPIFLQGSELAEVGLAALLAGRHALAGSMLAELGRSLEAPAHLAFLLLAGRWALWTGRPEEVLPLETAMSSAVDRVIEALEREGAEEAPGPLGAAFPSAARILELVTDGMEPLGRPEWTEELRARMDEARADRGRRSGKGEGRLALPVVGGSGRQGPGRDPDPGPPGIASEGDPREGLGRPLLPSPGDFGAPGGAGQAARRTVQAARLVRSWVEGALGAAADAAYGRLTLGPRIPADLDELAVRALRVGDARVSLDCRRTGATYTFLLRQESGRTPLNLVFQPRIPFPALESVRLGDEAASVEVREVPGGVQVRCQFPLDSERRMTIVGD